MRLWFRGSSFSSKGAAGPGSEGVSRAPADRHADAVHLLLALTSGEAREAVELAVSSPSIIRLFAGGIFHGGKSHQDAVDGSAAGQGAAE